MPARNAALRHLATGTFAWAGLSLALAGALACGGGHGTAAKAGSAPPPLAVEVRTLAPTPVERVGNFVAVVKSRRSAVIQPQIEGLVTRIATAPGARVRTGDLLLEVDATSQQAAVAALQAARTARAAEASLARQQEERARHLFELGVGSRQDYDQAIAAREGADAVLQSFDDQIRQQRNELGWYRVTAPTAGVVGDVPVRVGDRVTKSTVLTTIDDSSGLEAYVNVPVERGPDLATGLPVRLLGEGGAVLATERVTFVAPTVDGGTQTILVKAALGGPAGRFRAGQFVRAQILYSTAPALTVPVVATTRISGRHFVFLAADGPEGTRAEQRGITVGSIVGNDYVVVDGLAAGDRLIVTGVQKLGDGAPITPTDVASADGA